MATTAAVLDIMVKASTGAAVAGLKKTDDQLRRTDKQTKRTEGRFTTLSRVGGRSFGVLATGAKAGGLAVGAGLVVGLKKATEEAREAAKVSRQTGAVLKSTGGAANVSAKQIERLATSISEKVGVDDEAIQSAENLLLTFTKVRNETGKGNKIFNEATKTVVDMSAALDQDLKSSSIQVGKALNDPIKGITALQRVGVSFTAEQKEMVKGWVESGQTLKAQRFILKELKTEFGGSAAAQADGMDRLKVTANNLLETLGGPLNTALNKAADATSRFIEQFRAGTGLGGRFREVVEKVRASVADVMKVLTDPKLTASQKFDRLKQMFGDALSEGLSVATGVAAKYGPKIAAAIARGMASWWYGANPLTKLLGLAAVVRLVGGKGALMSTGAAIGRMLGGGISVGLVSGAAGGAAGGAAAGGLLGKLRGRLLPLAKRAGLAGVGIALADSVFSEFGRRATEKSPDFFKALGAKQGPKPFGVDLFGAAEKVPVLGGVAGLEKDEEAARRLGPILQDIANKSKAISPERAKQLKDQIRGIGGVSGPALAQFNALINGAVTKGKQISLIRNEFGRLKSGAVISLRDILATTTKNFQLIQQSMGVHTARGRRAVQTNFTLGLQAIKRSMADGTLSVEQGMAGMRRLMSQQSGLGKAAIGKNYGAIERQIMRTMSRGGKLTEEGMKFMREVMVNEMKDLGLSSSDIRMSLNKKASARKGFTQPGQTGLIVSGGKPSGDSVHALLERGEVVINRKAVAAMGGPQAVNAVNRHIPRFQAGGIIPGFAAGGIPRVSIDSTNPLGAVPKIGNRELALYRGAAQRKLSRSKATSDGGGPKLGGGAAVAAMIRRANAIDAMDYPYVWGGGHGTFKGPYDCSGAVSAVLHSAGLLSSPMVSGAFTSWGAAGPGKHVSIFANPAHMFMAINGKGWGTGGNNPGGGAGWLPYSSRSGFTVRHPPGLQRGGVAGERLAALAARIPKRRRTARVMKELATSGLMPGLRKGGIAGRFQKGGMIGRFTSTSYGPPWNSMNGTGVTRTGVDLRPAKKAYGIAVDPRRIRLGSKVWAWPNPFGYRGAFKAFDTGGAIKGNRIDFYDWRGRSKQLGWGRRAVEIFRSNPFGGGGRRGGRRGDRGRGRTPQQIARDRALDLTGRGVAPGVRKGQPLRPTVKGQSFTPYSFPRGTTPEEAEAGESGPSAAEVLAEAQKALAEEVKGLKSEVAKQNAFSASVAAVGLAQAHRALADMVSGQLGGMTAQRLQTAGDGRLARY